MKKYQSVEVTETQLEDLIRQAPGQIETGLRFVDHQRYVEQKRLDALLVDSGNALVVAELKVTEDDNMLMQALDYYDYVVQHLDRYARLYKTFKIDENQDPRLFLVAPSFSVALLNRVKWLNVPVSLFTFQCIEVEGQKNEILPVFKEISPPAAQEKPKAYTIDEHLDYITDGKIKSIAKGFIREMQDWDKERIEVKPVKYAISVKYSGHVLTYISPRRTHLVISDAEWTPYPIHSNKDLNKVKARIRAVFDELKG
jgi:hypothetical protein